MSSVNQYTKAGYWKSQLQQLPARPASPSAFSFQASAPWIMLIVATIGIGVAGYLAWVGLTSSKIAGCSGGSLFDCNHVTTTKWSTVMGIPVGVPALGLYAVMIGCLAYLVGKPSDATPVAIKWTLVTSAAIAGLAAVWFISLQLFVVKHLCSYCLVTHTCSLVIAGLALSQVNLSMKRKTISGILAFGAIGSLALVQTLSPAPPTFEVETFPAAGGEASSSDGEVFGAPVFDAPDNAADSAIFEAPGHEDAPKQKAEDEESTSVLTAPVSLQINSINPAIGMSSLLWITIHDDDDVNEEERRLVPINGGQFKLDVDQWPICGDPNASKMTIEMFDYTCPHCRKSHASIKSAMDRMNQEFAVLSLVVPMNSRCNSAVTQDHPKHATACELAHLSIAVWQADPEKYSEYHDWLFTGEHAPDPATARSRAATMVGQERLDEVLKSGTPQNYVARLSELYRAVGSGQIPKMFIGNQKIVGEINSADALIEIIQRQSW